MAVAAYTYDQRTAADRDLGRLVLWHLGIGWLPSRSSELPDAEAVDEQFEDFIIAR